MNNFFNWFEAAVAELMKAIEAIKAFFDKYFSEEEETTGA